jgi:hypothetical protein
LAEVAKGNLSFLLFGWFRERAREDKESSTLNMDGIGS